MTQNILTIEINHRMFPDKEINLAIAEKTIKDIVTALGIEAGIQVMKNEGTDDFIRINDTACAYPDSLEKESNDYIQALQNNKEPIDLFSDFIISNIIWLQPHVLFSDDWLLQYMPAINSTIKQHEKVKQHCREIIDELLSLKISLADKPLIADITDKYLNSEFVDWNRLREDLIEALSGKEIGICIHETYLNEIITAKADENLFAMMRDGLFYENGINYPSFKIIVEKKLPDNTFCFTINSFTSNLYTGLMPGKVLVNETTDRLLLLGITGVAATNPANGNNAALINAAENDKVVDAGLTTWNSLGYVILCFSSFLRKYGYLCINQNLVSNYIKQLQLVFPVITDLIEKQNLLPVTVKALRLLAKDEISIRNMRVILEAILESDYIIADGHKYIIFDERIPVFAGFEIDWKHKAENVAEFVRTKLKNYISHKYTKGQSTLVVYLLDAVIERLTDPALTPIETLDNETRKKICEAVGQEVTKLPVSSQPYVFLTTVNVRPHFKKLIELRFPHLAVLSYQELSPVMNIQPIGRISIE